MECKSLRESGDTLGQFDIVHYAVSVDDIETNTKFAQSIDANYPILSDATKATAKAYGVLAPMGFARRWTFYIGPDGKILYVDREVKTQTAGADIVARLEQLKVKKK